METSAQPYDWSHQPTLQELLQDVVDLQQLPAKLASLLKNLPEEGLKYTYREGGWNIGQIVHHLADASMNNFIRTKLALVENNPTIKTWEQDDWAAELDYTFSIESSYTLIIGLVQRWSLLLLEVMKRPDLLQKTFHHPDSGNIPLDKFIHFNAWHTKRHIGHINQSIALKLN
jgi:hypothetical protein